MQTEELIIAATATSGGVPAEFGHDADSLAGITVASASPGRQALRRFVHHKGAIISTVILAVFIVFVIFAPITARYGINEQIAKIDAGRNFNLPPRAKAWFGTDDIGRDVYSLIIHGARVSLFLSFIASTISVIIGGLVGAIAGMKGGLIDDIVMRVTDVFLGFPVLVSLLVMRNVLANIPALKPIVGSVGSIRFLVVLFSIFGWMTVARLVRAQVLSIKEREFVEATRALGAGGTRIVLRHIIPNSIGPLLVALSLGMVGVIVGESTLALFGYGPQPGSDTTSLGLLVSASKSAVRAGYWWLVVFPIGALVLITVCFSFIGDGLRDATDPKATQGRA